MSAERWRDLFAVGDRVRHYGTRQWGFVREVIPTRYGVELVVDRVVERADDISGRGQWEGTKIDAIQRDGAWIFPGGDGG